jgi:hypothetical protein
MRCIGRLERFQPFARPRQRPRGCLGTDAPAAAFRFAAVSPVVTGQRGFDHAHMPAFPRLFLYIAVAHALFSAALAYVITL